MGGIKQRWLITIFNKWRSVTRVTLSHGDMEVYATKGSNMRLVLIAVIHFLSPFIDPSASSV